MDGDSLNGLISAIGNLASISAAIFSALVFLLLKKKRKATSFIKSDLKVQPGGGHYESPIYYKHYTKRHVDKVSLLIENATPDSFFVVALSNLDDFRKVFDISRFQNRGLREGDIEGELYFPLMRLDTLRNHPGCEIREWDEKNRRYSLVINIDVDVTYFFFCIGNNPSADSEVTANLIISGNIETTLISGLKAKLFGAKIDKIS